MSDLRWRESYHRLAETRRARFGLVSLVFKFGTAALAAAVATAALLVWLQLKALPDLSTLGSYDTSDSMQIYDRYDRLVLSIKGEERRVRVRLDQVSPSMEQAVLAVEDHDFYQHHGINPVSITRAFLNNLLQRRIVEGGSTITQQLAKNLFFEEARRTFQRKIAEAVLALELERRFSKEQILEMYLNEAYFGNGAYGVEQAAVRYFGRHAGDLSLGESAFLAGLIKSPSYLGEPANRNSALRRQREVLEKMVRYGFVSAPAATLASRQTLLFRTDNDDEVVAQYSKYPYFVSYVADLVRQRYTPLQMRRHGLRIYTSLDPTVQELAEETLRKGIASAPAGVTQGALATVCLRDGSIVALVGGTGDFQTSQFNRATHPHTAGSSFKPFVYAAALDQQILTPESAVDDTPLSVKLPNGEVYTPHNFDRSFMGEVTVRQALAYSRNVCAVRVAQQVGIENVIAAARRAGVKTDLKPHLSLALGSAAVSPVDMAGAYATFARGGLYIRPWVLRRVEDGRGRVLQVFNQPLSRAFGPDTAGQVVDMLRDVVAYGTGQEAKLAFCEAAGKTGTADQARDLWFIGFTPDLATAVWAGNDENLPVAGSHVTGGTVVARIWRDYNQSVYSQMSSTGNRLIVRTVPADSSKGERRPAPRPRPAPRVPPVAGGLAGEPAGGFANTAATAPRKSAPVVLTPQQARMDARASPAPSSLAPSPARRASPLPYEEMQRRQRRLSF